jgi:antitoxin (DNA-binding transcriptional repressor) of toxin-antitoxin stability system
MKISAAYFRQHVYEILDRVLLTGEPVEIERHGKIIRLAPATHQRPPRDEGSDNPREFSASDLVINGW